MEYKKATVLKKSSASRKVKKSSSAWFREEVGFKDIYFISRNYSFIKVLRNIL